MKKRVVLFLSCLFLSIGFILAQTAKISGTVVDNNGESVIGASVVVKGTTIGVATDLDGKFSIEVPDGKTTLVFTLVGMNTVEQAASQGMRVVMSDKETLLDDVVVVAYGTTKKEALTGSVAAISASDISKRPVSNVGAALEGMGTGIQVSTSLGEPGEKPSIRIRGFSSMLDGANDPLIILDGSTFNGNIASINPDDIENISVLKDAASAALYGSRAANGVILITSKKAKSGDRGTINLSIRQGFTNRALKEYDRLGANDYMQAAFDGYRNQFMSKDGMSFNDANAAARKNLIPSILGYNIYGIANEELFDNNGVFNTNAKVLSGIASDLDWFDIMERTGYRQDYNLSGTAATEKLNVFYSMGYLEDKGYIKTSDYNRLSGRINVEYSPRKWLKTGLNLSGSYEKRNRANTESSTGFVNPFYYARFMSPIYPVHLHDLSTGDYILDDFGNKQYDRGAGLYDRKQNKDRHIAWETELNKNLIKTNRTSIEPYAQIKFLNDFTFLIRGNMTIKTMKESQYGNAIIGDGAGAGRSILYDDEFKEYTTIQQLTWNKTLKQIHNLEVMAAHEYYSWMNRNMYIFKQGESMPGNDDFLNFSTTNAVESYTDRYKLDSYLARAKYNFDERYFAEASFRRDGSSMFGSDNRWGNFWSVGGSWIVSREAFMKNLSWVDYLKARISYGQVGNDTFGARNYYLYQSLYALDKNGGSGAIYRQTIADPMVTWESMDNFTAGIDGRLFDRVNFTIDYFDKRNRDLLFDVTRPLSVGSTNSGSNLSPTIRKNVGTVKNYGFEISADADIIRTKDFRWNLGADITLLKNKIIELPEDMRENGFIYKNSRWFEGKSRFDLYVYQWAGVDQMTGDGLYYADTDKTIPASQLVEINGEKYTTGYSYAKRDYSGSAIPDAFGSIRTSLAYKDFTFSFLCTYGIGGKVLDGNYADLMSVSTSPSAMHKDIKKAWKAVPEGMTETSSNRIDKNGVPALNYSKVSNNHTYASTRFITDASYFAIKNVSLNYNIPKSIVSRLDISNMSLSANVENLGLFTKRKGLDPQQSFDGNTSNVFVPARTVSFSLNVSF